MMVYDRWYEKKKYKKPVKKSIRALVYIKYLEEVKF